MSEIKIVKRHLLPYLDRELVDGLYIVRQSYTKGGLIDKIEIKLVGGDKNKSMGVKNEG